MSGKSQEKVKNFHPRLNPVLWTSRSHHDSSCGYRAGSQPDNVVHANVAVASYNEDDDGVFWYSITFNQTPTMGTIIHECSHIVDYIFETHGVPGGIESTEIRAYMLSLMVLDVCEIFKIPADAV